MRPTPSGIMMNGPMWSLGCESGLKSGTSTPVQICAASFQETCLRAGSQGLPETSHDARLYSTRRFAGHDHAQFGYTPRPDGSSVPRRASCGPASVHDPAYNQLPHEVVPSSRSQAKPGNCCPALMVCCVFGSVTSAIALPFTSLAISESDGCRGSVYGHVACRIGSGNLPPSAWYSSRSFRKICATMSWSSRASPGGGSAMFFHCSQRAELVM